MQARVRLNPLYESAEDFNKIRKSLSDCQAEMADVRRELAQLSNMELPMESLSKCESRLEEYSLYCSIFGNAIVQIAGLWERNENRLIENSEGIRKTAERAGFVSVNLTDLRLMYQKIFTE